MKCALRVDGLQKPSCWEKAEALMANILHIFGTELQGICKHHAHHLLPLPYPDVEDGLEIGITSCTAAAVASLAAGLAYMCLNSEVILN